MSKNDQLINNKPGETDGRKQRSNASRQRVVTAYLALLREGKITPSAEEVAKKADVSQRTVFRRFNEMELLYREISVEVENRFTHQLDKPWRSKDWEGRLAELIKRKVAIYEDLLPYRRAGHYLKVVSPFIKEKTAHWDSWEQEKLEGILPISRQEQPELFAAIAACLNADHWLCLRDVQGLTPQQATKAMEMVVTSLLVHFVITF